MSIVLTAVAVTLYWRMEVQLDQTFNQGLRSRGSDISSLIQQPDTGLDARGRSVLDERGESFAQILDADGAVIDTSPRLRAGPLLTPSQLRRAASQTIFVERPNPFEPVEPARLLATAVNARGQRLVVVVGAGLDDRNSSVAHLALLLAVGMPLALLFAALAGYGVVTAALRPVESMRLKADAISEHEPGERLPVAATDDEIARLGKTLNAMLVRLETAFERERTFVADASHELRTPLAILKTELELALRRGRSPEELHQALQSAAEETDRLAQLAESLLVIARADQGRLPVATSSVETGKLLDGVRRRFESRARLTRRAILVEDGSDAPITADPHRLEQALDNLVENALQHGAGTIRLSASLRDGHVSLHVRDEGPGFPADFIDSAFERFTRADQARGRGGSGLGLAIVRVIAHAHGGQARASNVPDGGAEVRIDLPQRHSALNRVPTPAA